jgi:predicted CoA-binding protein
MAHQNPPDEVLRRLLTESRSIAVVGASSNPERASHGIFGRLLAAGYRVVPINPNETSVHGQPALASLRDVPGGVDLVDVFRRPEVAPDVARDAVAIGARVLWLQSGIRSEEAAAIATAAGLSVVMDACIGVALSRLRIAPRQGAA